MTNVFYFTLLFCLYFLSVNSSGSSPWFTVDNFPTALATPICDDKITYFNIILENRGPITYTLDVRNGYLPSGSTIQLWELWGGANQIFYPIIYENNLYIRSLLNHKCLSATVPLSLTDCNQFDLAQRWTGDNIPSSFSCSDNQESFLLGRVFSGSACLHMGTYTTFFNSTSVPRNWLVVAPDSCTDSSPRWRLRCTPRKLPE
jgi:hypothetical protein